MPDENAYYRVFSALASYLIREEKWSEPFTISLSDENTQNSLKEATGLPWGTIRSLINRLATDGLISVTSGSGRGNRTTVSFIHSPHEVLSRYLMNERSRNENSNLDNDELAALEAEIARLSELPKRALPDLAWWEVTQTDAPNQILFAPSPDVAFSDDELIGRDDIIVEVASLLQTHHAVALVGQPGVGKTHFVANFQRLLVEGSQGGLGVFWVKLSETSTLDELVSLFLTRSGGKGLGVSTSSSLLNKKETPISQAYALLTELRKSCYLLIIDNFERILNNKAEPLDEGYQVFLQVILEHDLGQSRVILVSHWIPKDPRGRRPITKELPSMTSDEGVRFLYHLGVKLPRQTVERIVSEVGGNPLAMQLLRTELVMSQPTKPLLDVAPAARAVEDAFGHLNHDEILTIGGVAVLTEDANEVLLRNILAEKLAIHPHQLSGLLDDLTHTKRILTYSWSESASVRIYGVHPLVQSYVINEALTKEEVLDLHRSVLRYWIERTDSQDLLSKAWLSALKHSIDAESHEVTSDILFKQGVAKALLSSGLLGQLKMFLENMLKDIQDLLAETPNSLLQIAKKRGIENFLPEALWTLGLVYWRRGELAKAERFLRMLNTPVFSANAHYLAALAGVRLDQGYHKEGLQLVRSALTLAQSTGDTFAEMEAWGWIGYALDETGPVEECVDAYQHAIKLSAKLADDASRSITEARLGMIYWKVGEVEKAGPHFEMALEIASSLGDPYYLGIAQGDMGHYYMDKPGSSEADIRKAIECYTKANQIHQQVGVRRGEGFWTGQLGRAYTRLKSYKRAHQHLKEAVDIHIEVGDRTAVPRHLWYLAQLYLAASRRTPRLLVLALAYYQVAFSSLYELDSIIEAKKIQTEFQEVLAKIPLERRERLLQMAESYMVDIRAYQNGKGGRLP